MMERKLTPSALARALGVTIQEVSNHSSGRPVMSISTAKKYAYYFGIKIDDLYEWPNVPKKVVDTKPE
jgi:DNA-binding XRE family transcriptional regulator